MKIKNDEVFEIADEVLKMSSTFDFVGPLIDIFKSMSRRHMTIMIERTTSPGKCRRELKKFGIRSWNVRYSEDGNWFWISVDDNNVIAAETLLKSIGANII